MKTRLGANAVAVQLPIGAEDTFEGIIDLFEMKAVYYIDALGKEAEYREIPEELKALAEERREILVEAIAE